MFWRCYTKVVFTTQTYYKTQEVFDLNTQIIAQFGIIDIELLSVIEGGKNNLGCILGTAGMAGVGFLYAGPAGQQF